jgi:uncharacterized membrane protein (TIGR02234 family)
MSRRLAVLLGLLFAAVQALLGRTVWVRAEAVDLTGAQREVTVSGIDATPAVFALALVSAAAAIALALSGRRIRFVPAAVLVLSGAGGAAAAWSVRADPVSVARGPAAELTGLLGGALTATATPWVLLTLVAVLGILVGWQGGRWPTRTAGSRYRRDASRDAREGARGSADPLEDPAATWDALTRGDDPSSR